MDEDLLILILRESLLGRDLARLDNYLIKFQSNCLAFYDFLFHCVLGHQTVDIYFFLLANTVRSVHCLQIDLGVPVRVIQDDMVSSHQIESQASGLS